MSWCSNAHSIFSMHFVLHPMQEIRLMDKEVRAWDAYTSLDSTVKNLLTSLRAVTELQNPAIRDRHWYQLMNSTGVSLKFTVIFSKLYILA